MPLFLLSLLQRQTLLQVTNFSVILNTSKTPANIVKSDLKIWLFCLKIKVFMPDGSCII